MICGICVQGSSASFILCVCCYILMWFSLFLFLQSIWNRLKSCGLVDRCRKVEFKKATIEQLQLCHTESYSLFFGVNSISRKKLGMVIKNMAVIDPFAVYVCSWSVNEYRKAWGSYEKIEEIWKSKYRARVLKMLPFNFLLANSTTSSTLVPYLCISSLKAPTFVWGAWVALALSTSIMPLTWLLEPSN